MKEQNDINKLNPKKDDFNVSPDLNYASSFLFPVYQAKSDIEDIMVEIRWSKLEKMSVSIKSLIRKKTSLTELLIATATSFVGATLSALVSGINLVSPTGVICFIVLPILSAGLIVAYLFMKNRNVSDINRISKEILSEIPEIEDLIRKDKKED